MMPPFPSAHLQLQQATNENQHKKELKTPRVIPIGKD